MQAIAPPSASTQAIAAEIRARVSGKFEHFYAARGYQPLWAASGHIGPEADTLLGFLGSADLDGLNPSNVDSLRKAIDQAQSGDPRAVANAELKLSKAYARYVDAMRRIRKPTMTYVDEQLLPKKLTPEMALGAAGLVPSFPDYIASMGWMSPHYVRIRDLMARAQRLDNPPDVVKRLRLNLDRARELPSPWTHHVVVDAASGRLWFYQGGKEFGTMKVVVGKAASPTPMLAGMLRYAILNPYWNVPVDLAQNLIAPKILSGRTLASMNMEALSDWSAAPQKLKPAAINWTAVASGAQQLRLRQLPGGSNAMGRVKFLFPNDLGIYLHDTPEKDLLAKEDRHFSNGCIRLDNAPSLGKWLLGKPVSTKGVSAETAVSIPLPVPVYLTYLTPVSTDQGVGFLNDVYGRDASASQ
ncbi:MAG: L,D-transpeptidase family protein [Sphingobium sp.]